MECKQPGLPFEEVVVPLYDETWERRRQGAEFAPSAGKVPILWDGDMAVWDSLAIVEFLAERAGRDRFWPAEEGARAYARSMAAEMHSGFVALRRKYSMNVRCRYPAADPGDDVLADLARITALWAQARDRWGAGGNFLFGAFGAADIMFAPVATRIVTYALPVAPSASAYIDAVLDHPFLREWIAAAQHEQWVIERFEGSNGSVMPPV